MDIPSTAVTGINFTLHRVEALAAVAANEVCQGDAGHAVCLTDMLKDEIAKLRDQIEPFV
jgi:hypothetical protein